LEGFVKILLILGAVLGAALLYLISLFNRLVRLRAMADEAFAGIDVQLKRRWDLIPKLVAVVQGASSFEKSTLTAVTEARQKAQAAQTLPQREAAEQALGLALGNIFAVHEAYPELKATQGYLELQKQISALEDELQLARRYFNAVVRDYNSFGQSFPALLFAPAAGFKPRDYFMAEGAERESPSVVLS
jgi:LemA protein